MQMDEFVAEGPACNALNKSFPVNRCASQQWAGEIGQWVEVDVIYDRVYSVCDNSCEHSRQ